MVQSLEGMDPKDRIRRGIGPKPAVIGRRQGPLQRQGHRAGDVEWEDRWGERCGSRLAERRPPLRHGYGTMLATSPVPTSTSAPTALCVCPEVPFSTFLIIALAGNALADYYPANAAAGCVGGFVLCCAAYFKDVGFDLQTFRRKLLYIIGATVWGWSSGQFLGVNPGYSLLGGASWVYGVVAIATLGRAFRPTGGKSGGASYPRPSGDDSGPAGDDSGPAGDDSGPAGDDSGPAGDDSGPAGDDSGPLGA